MFIGSAHHDVFYVKVDEVLAVWNKAFYSAVHEVLGRIAPTHVEMTPKSAFSMGKAIEAVVNAVLVGSKKQSEPSIRP